jgi:hypothetical protein
MNARIIAGRRGAMKRAEGREYVRRELESSHPELLGLYRSHGHRFKGGHAGLEAFLTWAHNAGEGAAWDCIQAHVDRDVAALVAAYQNQESPE